MFLGMNARAYGIGLRNAAICGGVMIAVFYGLYQGIQRTTGLTGKDVTYTAFGILWVGIMIALIIQWWRNRRRGGEVLLDCGYWKAWPLAVLCCVAFVYKGNVYLLEPGLDPYDVGKGLFFISGALFYAFLGFRRTQFRQDGILVLNGFTPWNEIQDYDFDGDTDAILFITTPRKWMLQGDGGLYIPVQFRDEAERLLQERAPRNLTPADPAGVTQ